MKSLKNYLNIFVIAVIVFGISSCKKGDTGSEGPIGPAGPLLTGNLKGHVFCYDQYGNTVLINLKGIKDSINGTSNVVITDSTGYYSFANLSTGNYTFTIKASGYGNNEVKNLQFLGGGDTYHDVKLSQSPTFNVLTLTDSIAGANIIVKGTLPTDTRVRTVALFVGNVSNVSCLPLYYLNYFSKNTTATNLNTFSITIPINSLYDLGIASGSTAYFAAYGAASNFASSSEYEDMSTGKTVFTALSSTPVNSNVVVP